MWSIYIQKFGKISVKFSVLVAPIMVTFGTEEGNFGPLLHATFYPISAMCRPCRVKNLNLNTEVT